MATKTFKIGLSNTDKQNMAQDVYERLLALTFPEYDTSTEYSVGDFVVYNDQLYKCIGATTGAWDSSKWQLATLNDLVSDIEDAVQFVNDKANVDGNYPTMTVGVADNLSPYSETSGINQHVPFDFQASGTNNGDDPTATVSALAIMSEKRGNTVVVNQKMSQPHQTNVTSGSGIGGFNYVGGHKLLIIQSYSRQATPGDVDYQVWFNADINSDYDINQRNQFVFWERNDSQHIAVIFQPYANYTALDWFDFRIIDLTQWFNGDIPQDLLDHPDHFFRYYQGSLAYNEGTLVNANSRYLKAIGRNQWDEEWELGALDSSTGQPISDNNRIRSKNYNNLIPGATYYLYCGLASSKGELFLYDKDKTFIGNAEINNTTAVIPSNACYFKIGMYSSYGTIYNHDITISLYYEGESGYNQYYPYELLTNNDTGVEVLRSAGGVADIKLPDGTITRKVSEYTILGTESVYSSQFDGVMDYAILIVPTIMGGVLLNLPNNIDNTISVTNSGNQDNHVLAITFVAGTYNSLEQAITAITGKKVNIPLATTTTEQGTPYSENVAIDDFGTMDFSGTSGVPQGNALFYPVDYKAYLDTLHNYTDGDPDNLALKTDLPTAPNTYLTSLAGYDATKTQVLKNIEGVFTWVTEGE